jgi:hypothetical protein
VKVCVIEDCERKQHVRGWCNAHYKRWLRHGDPKAGGRPQNPGAMCSIEGCTISAVARTWCAKHWQRWKANGDPTKAGPQIMYGTDNPRWIGQDAGYDAVHDRLKIRRGSAKSHACEFCGDPAAEWAYDRCDPNARRDSRRGCLYSVDLDHYMPLCLPCHRLLDSPKTQWRDHKTPADPTPYAEQAREAIRAARDVTHYVGDDCDPPHEEPDLPDPRIMGTESGA